MGGRYKRCEKNDRGWYAIRDPETRRRWRAELLERQGGVCGICFCRFPDPDELNESARIRYSMTFDHIVPYADGGHSEPSNLRVVHYACNQARASKDAASMAERVRNMPRTLFHARRARAERIAPDPDRPAAARYDPV